MLLIKTNFQINNHFLNELSNLINGEIKQVSSCGIPIDLTLSDKWLDNLFLGVLTKKKIRILAIRALFFYDENINDEVSTLSMTFEENNTGVKDVRDTPMSNHVSKINKIKIYGEERIRVWSELKKRDYFHQKVDIAVGDYYFNNTIIRFELSDSRQINIHAHRQGIQLSFNKNLNTENDFYLISDLSMEEDLLNDNVWSNIQRIKCQYEIDENGIKKNIKHEWTS
jgi:hypothetical protein